MCIYITPKNYENIIKMKQTQLNLYWEINLGFSNVHLGFVDDSKFVSRQDPKIDS